MRLRRYTNKSIKFFLRSIVTFLPKDIDQAILEELAGKPAGLSASALGRRLSEADIPATDKTLCQRLLDSQLNGVLESRAMRWRRRPIEPPDAKAAVNGSGISDFGGFIRTAVAILEAVPVSVESGSDAALAPAPSQPGDAKASPELLARLLPHYRESLRTAGAARLMQTPDRYRTQFLLLAPGRAWWPEEGSRRRVRIRADHVPATLKEALYARRGQPVMLGYPLSVHGKGDDVFIKPIGVLACRWVLEDGGDLVVDPIGTAPVLNPDWIGGLKRNRSISRVMAWAGQSGRDPDDGVTPVGSGEWADMQEMAKAIDVFMATELRTAIMPALPEGGLSVDGRDGIFNVLGLFLTQGNRYTQGACRDLGDLASMEIASLAGTALGALFGMAGVGRTPIPVLPPLDFGEDQLVAVRDGLSKPLTVVTGPPGTGKSQVVAALMISAALAGRSVLFASRTHQALDAVEERLKDLLPDRVLLARAKALDQTQEFSFVKAIDAVLARGSDPSSRSRLEARKVEVQATENPIWENIEAAERLSEISDEIGRLTVEIARIESELAKTGTQAPEPVVPLWLRLFRLLTGRKAAKQAASHRLGSLQMAFDEATARHREQCAVIDRLERAHPLGKTLATLSKEAASLLVPLADCLEALEPAEREHLAGLRGDLGLNAGKAAEDPRVYRALWERGHDLVLRHFPLWATTTLAAANRIPLIPGLFDYVVIDEATTCDIPSAIPLLARAKQAVIVGDKLQTSMIVDMDAGRELEMLGKAGLDIPGIGRFAFTQSNIFDLASSMSGAAHHILRDHFRCHPDIAGYVSEAFYGRRLTVLTPEKTLHPPPGMKPGLDWSDVRGPLVKTGTGCVSQAEAEAVAEHLWLLLDQQGYEGTVGVVTPFARQAELIIRSCEDRIAYAKREKANLRVATSHAFQGDARDVVLISLCYGASMPQGAAWFMRGSRELVNVAVSRARAVCHVFGDRDAALRSGIPHLSMLARRIGGSGDAIQSGDRFESPWEKRLYDALCARGLKPIPQYPLAGRRLDLALIQGSVKLDIEVDGDAYHRDPDGFRKVSDIWRDHVVSGLGWVPVRFWVYDLKNDMEACVDRVIAQLG